MEPAPGSGPPDTLRVILVTGAPGVGKTDTARHLVSLLGERAAVLDTDALASIVPLAFDDAFHALVEANLRAVLPGFQAWGATTVVLSGVARSGGLLEVIERACRDIGAPLHTYVLHAEVEEVRRRIRSDAKVQGAAGRLEWLHLIDELTTLPGATTIDTMGRSAQAVAAAIATIEAAPTSRATVSGVGPSSVRVTVDEARSTVRAAMVGVGVPVVHADLVASRLVDLELEGHRSHGLLRVAEYLGQVRSGAVDGSATPLVEDVDGGSVVDGRDCLGAVALPVIAQTIFQRARVAPAVVAVRRCGHLGTLRSLGREVADAGCVLLGFVNYQGGGQKVIPYGGTEPRLASDPMVFAVPMGGGPPLVVDLSTSSTAEGSVRVAARIGASVAAGHLVGRDGRPVLDPNELYREGSGVGLAPLGGPSAHKGFGLALVVEALAGAVAGGGTVGPGGVRQGNAALFVAFPIGLFVDDDQVFADLAQLERHVTSSNPIPGGPPVRLPGRSLPDPARGTTTHLTIDAAVWHGIELAAKERPLA